jgi:hypothetical protein
MCLTYGAKTHNIKTVFFLTYTCFFPWLKLINKVAPQVAHLTAYAPQAQEKGKVQESAHLR